MRNVLLGQPVSTTLNNTLQRNLSLLVDGELGAGNSANVTSLDWGSTSASGSIHITLDAPTVIEKVVVYWSGNWGAQTNSFAVLLSNAGATSTAYETTSATMIEDRTDELDLVVLGTAGPADTVILECRHRNGEGYAIYEIQAHGKGLHSLSLDVPSLWPCLRAVCNTGRSFRTPTVSFRTPTVSFFVSVHMPWAAGGRPTAGGYWATCVG